MSFGIRFKELRINAKLTQEKLAQGITTKGYISQIEKDVAKPSAQILAKLAPRLNCSVEDFFIEPKNSASKLIELKQEIRHLETLAEESNFDQILGNIEKIDLSIDDINNMNQTDLGILHWVKGEVCVYNKDWESAINHFKESINYFTNNSNERRLKSTNSLANTYLKMEENENAFKLLADAFDEITLYQIGGLVKQSILINLGIAHGKVREYRSAIRLLREAYRINQATSLHYRNGEIFMSLGICYKRMLEPEKAQEAYRQSLKYFDLNDDQEHKAGVYFNLALLYIDLEQYENAIENLLIALNIFEYLGINDSFILAKIYLANTFIQVSRYEEAIEQCSQVLAKSKNSKYLLKGHITLGDIHFNKQNYDYALTHYLNGLNILTKNMETEDLYKKIALSYYKLNDYQNSALYFYKYNIDVMQTKSSQRINEIAGSWLSLICFNFKSQVRVLYQRFFVHSKFN